LRRNVVNLDEGRDDGAPSDRATFALNLSLGELVMFDLPCRLCAPQLLSAIALALVAAACAEPPTSVAPLRPGPSAHPLIVPTTQGAIQISAGDQNTCAVLADGQLACWGLNLSGQSTPPSGTFTQVSAGSYHSCGVRVDGTLACWGENSEGESSPPAGVFTQVSTGQLHSCGLRSDGTLACWGSNWLGQSSPPPGTFTQLSAGDNHGCAIATDGTLACWGSNSSGQATPPLGTFLQLSSGGSYTCGLKTDGTMACWGSNGDNRTAAPAGQVVRLSVGYALKHNCAITVDGSLTCWGQNSDGETTPPSGTFTQVSAGGHHSCAIRTDGSPACWGSNTFGQLTLPTTHVSPSASFAATPSSVPANSSFTLALSNARVPGYPQPATFTYAFDCGDGTGYGAASPNASASCPAATAGARTVHGKVIDQDGDYTEYTASVTVTQLTQAITFTSQPPNPALVNGTYVVSATGGASGNPVVFSSLTPNVCTLSGSTVRFVAVGTCTIAANQAGNANYSPAPQVTQGVAIGYGFVGLSQPIDNLPVINKANAGQAVPIKWRLVDASGAPVTTLTTATVTVVTLTCSGGSTPDQLEEYATGSSGLQNLGNGYYQFTWKTPKSYASSCKTMHLDLGAGVTHQAYFEFK
jgi:hypothetical protein